MDINKVKNKFIRSRRTSRTGKTDMSITIILLIGILIVVNFFSYNIFYRLDLTENKIYSISDATKKTVAGLDDIVNIKAYFSDNLPSQLLSLRQEVEDVLDEYSAYSGGKIKISFIDPGEDETLQQELYYKGIPQLTFDVVEKDKRQLVTGYMGLAISFGDSVEVIPAIKQNVSDLEYQLTTKIKKVTNQKSVVLGFLTSQGTVSLQDSLKTASQSLRDIYTIREVKLEEDEPTIDSDINTLIIVGPKEQFSEDQLKAINKYVFQGGGLLVLLDGVAIGDGLIVNPQATGLDTLLDKYGIKINSDLVADKSSGMASFSQGFFSFSTPYAFWPKITGDGFANNYSAVSGLENVILPWVSSLDIDEAKLASAQKNILITTTDNSWTQTKDFQIIPNKIPAVTSGLGKHNLAVAINGELKNAYPEEGSLDTFLGKIIVVGDSDFVADSFVANNPDNLNLFLNLVDSLSLDDDLIEIRSKAATSRPIDDANLDDSKRAAFRYMNVLGVTVLVIIFGIVRYYMRRRNRFVDDL